MLRIWGLALVLGLAGGQALAEDAAPVAPAAPPAALTNPPAPVSLANPSAFERTYGASLYIFDACGAELTGKQFRSVLVDKFAHCPFTPEARKHFAQWTRAQREKSVQAIKDMIIARGGLPVRLDGMASTCHEQLASPASQQLLAALDRYQQGQATANSILPGPCDAEEITP